jgi:integrase
MVKVRPWLTKDGRQEGWEVDIRFRWPSTRRWHRVRLKSPVTSKTGSKRWGEEHEAALLERGPTPEPPPRPPAPTLKAFGARWMSEYCEANQLALATRRNREVMLRVHIYPVLGERPIDELGPADYDRLKAEKKKMSPRSVNNFLMLLHKVLTTAKDWGLIAEVPKARLLKVPKTEIEAYEPEEYERLVAAAKALDHQIYTAVLLGGDAGLRSAEISALQRGDVDLKAGRIVVQHNFSYEEESVPKGGRSRVVELTERLKAALKTQLAAHINPRIFRRQTTGGDLYRSQISHWVRAAERKAGLRLAAKKNGAVHKLRHTFGTALAAAGVPPREIQELMGHASLATTQIYLHLAKVHRGRGIRMLEASRRGGEIVETGSSSGR